jgi:peptidyl-tRNA hydrolase
LLDHGGDLRRMILIASDGRLRFGNGRLRRSGEMDHPGVQQVGRTFRTSQIARLVFGIGPLVEPQDSYRAERWPDEQWERIDRLDAVFERFVALLIRTQKLSDLAAVVNHADFWAEPRVGVSDPGGRPPGFQGTKG